MKNRLLLLALLLTFSLPRDVWGLCVYTSTTTGGLFNAPSTWTVSGGGGCGSIPSATDSIKILGPVVLNQNFTFTGAGRIDIRSGGSLIEDGTGRSLTLGTNTGPLVLDRLVIRNNARVLVSTLTLIKSEVQVNTGGRLEVNCNAFFDNQAVATIDGKAVFYGNLHLVLGNATLTGNGTLQIVGCVVGTNGALNQAIQGNLLVCVQNLPNLCGTGTCNGDIPVNNNANCLIIVPPPLPVELTEFQGTSRQRSVELTWATISERNSREFLVERSPDGKDFGAIGRVGAGGNTYGRREYQWQDSRPLAGPAYYRLRQVDQDGTFALSQTLSIRASDTPLTLAVWPAETAGRYRVSEQVPGTVLQLVTPDGRMAGTLPVTNGTVDLSRFAPGVYLMRLQTSEGEVTTRLAHFAQ